MPIDIQTKLKSYDGHMIIIVLKYMPVCCSPRLDADCEDIAFDKITEWSKKHTETTCYGNSEILLHKKMWDVLTRDKQGLRKEHSFVDWCRRIARIDAEGAATEHANNDSPFLSYISQHSGKSKTLTFFKKTGTGKSRRIV